MKIGLGTAQFGSHYGISNQKGVPSLHEVEKIIKTAFKAGIRIIDTAPGYGKSETMIGEVVEKYSLDGLCVVTKTPAFNSHSIDKEDANLLDAIFCQSQLNLNTKKVYGLMIHHCDDIFKPNGKLIYDKMLELKKTGQVEKIGASIYTAEQIDRLMDHYPVDIIQVPVNVFDQRLIQSGHLKKIKTQGIEIHARSIFLQGLLLMKPEDLPPHLGIASQYVKNYRKCIENKGLNPLQAALNFIFEINEVDYTIVGVNEESEINEVIDAAYKIEPAIDYSVFALSDESILNPAMWD